MKRILVVGAGYAGTFAAIRLAGRARDRAHVTLVDADGSLIQRLRLHQVAAGQHVPSYPLTALVGNRVNVVRGWATGLDPDRGAVTVAGEGGTRELRGDAIVLATGSTIDLDAIPGAAQHAHSVADEAAAERLHDSVAALGPGATVAVLGGGLTGIEIATELAAARPELRLRLITSGPLGGFLSERGRAHLRAALARLGVEAVDHARARAVEPGRVLLANGELACDLAIVCAGFVATPLAREAELAVDERGRVVVDGSLRSVSHPAVLAVGDAGNAARMSCHNAVPTGAHAADVLARELRGHAPRPFDFGSFHLPISLGRRDGLIQFTHHDDSPRDRILTGRAAALYKEIVTASGVWGMRWERRLPGLLRWPHAADVAT